MAQKPDPNTKEAHPSVGEHRMTMEDWLGAFPVVMITRLLQSNAHREASQDVTQPGNRQGEPSS